MDVPREEGPRAGGRREWLLAALACLLLAAWPLREALLDPSRSLLGVDTATTALPWSAVVADGAGVDEPGVEEVARPRNPGLSDQALVFYPARKWVSRSWRAGDPPLWNPLNYAGAPAAGNPQLGVFDPEVLLVGLLEGLFGDAGFHFGTTLTAWLRLASAALGAWLLARRLGLSRPGSALAAAAFALSGFQVLWLGHTLGHVSPLLPWVLWLLEGTRGSRPRRSAALAGLALWLAILGGHPETAFYVGAAAGVWSLSILRDDRRAGWLGFAGLALGALAAAFVLLPFVEYLGLSAAHAVRAQQQAAGQAHGNLGGRVVEGVDLVSLGVLLLAVAFALVYRASVTRDEEPPPEQGGVPGDESLPEPHGEQLAEHEPLERRAGPSASAGVWSAGVGVAFALAGVALVLAARGLADTAPLALVHDLHGSAGQTAGGYLGRGTYLEEASAWMAPLALGLALASLLSPRGKLRRRSLVAGLGLVAWLLALQAPGLLELYRFVPVIGLGATVRLASVSALMLGLLAGDGLDAAPRPARSTAALTLLLLLAAVLRPDAPLARPTQAVAPDVGEVAGFVLRPAAEITAGELPLEGWVLPALAVDDVRVRIEHLNPDGTPTGEVLTCKAEFQPGPSEHARTASPELVAAAPEGARYFRTHYMSGLFLPHEGIWRFTVEFRHGPRGPEPVGERVVSVSALQYPIQTRAWTLALTGLGLLALVTLGPGRAAWFLVGLVLLQGLNFARGQNPSAPASEAFPPTATEALLARELGFHRFLADPLSMPPSTGLVRNLRDLDGYDGLEVQAHNDYRLLTLFLGGRPGSPLLDWHAGGVPLDTPLFRLLGVSHLVAGAPLDAPGWELVAAPASHAGSAPEFAECFVYRDPEPMPRAFVVTRTTGPDEIQQRYAEWDPAQEAILPEPWTLEDPAAVATAELVELTNGRAVVRAELDGEGLLVLTEQAFPGWTVEVDGEPREMLTANVIFRAVRLGAGAHEVVFRYRPGSWPWSPLLSLAAAAGLLLLGLRRSPAPASATP